MDPATVEVRRSRRRRRTVTAYREAGKVIVCMPASFTAEEERRWIGTMLRRIEGSDARRRPTDDRLLARARGLSKRHLDQQAWPTSVRWSADQQARWASCTPADGTIRVSDRLKGVPQWVLDYVLVHELAHLVIAEHNDEFWALVGRFPRSERARGFLDGLSYAAGQPSSDGDAM